MASHAHSRGIHSVPDVVNPNMSCEGTELFCTIYLPVERYQKRSSSPASRENETSIIKTAK
jgi:hypothetical protein